MSNFKGRKNGSRREPSVCIQMMPGTLTRLRAAARMRRVGLSEYVVEAVLMRMKEEAVPSVHREKVSPERAKLEMELETAQRETANPTAPVGEPSAWAKAWPDLKRLAAEDKNAAMEIFRELRAGRAPAPRPDLLRLPESDAVEWLDLNYPLL